MTDIIADTGRGEQLVLDVRSSAPSSPETHQAWIRDDLTSGEQIGALEFGDGTQVPIYPDSLTVEDSVTKALQVSVGGQMGFIPTAPVDDATYDARRFPYNGVDYGLHSARRLSAIPEYGDYQWYIDEGTGTTLNPSIGSVTATINGATWQSESGPIGNKYLSFDGSGDFVETDSSIDAAQDTFTVFGWARIRSFTGFGHTLAGAASVGVEGSPGWYIATESTDGEILAVAGGSSTNRSTPFPSNEWGFVAAIYDGSSVRLITFSNTSELSDNSDSSNSLRSPRGGDTLHLGENGTGENHLDGDLDFWGYANTKLTKTEITELWEATKR